MISVLSKLQHTLLPLLLEVVSIYIKLSPIGGNDFAPVSPVGLDVFVDFTKFDILPLLFLSLHFVIHCCRRYPQLLGDLLIVISVHCILLYLVRLYVSIPAETLRQ